MIKAKKETISYRMGRVKSKGTSIEKIMGKALWSAGLRGYRKNDCQVIGKPDFCWRRKKIALFCDSSFWHGNNWNQEKQKIKVRKKYWYAKIEKTIRRDKENNAILRKEGWAVIRFWDFEIEKNIEGCLEKVAHAFMQ
jgi:DNA mismatch endonuclease Vsr